MNEDDKKTPVVLDKHIPEIVYEKQDLKTDSKKSVFIKVSGLTEEKAFENFKKVRAEVKA